jgi:serine/threonine protein kinase
MEYLHRMNVVHGDLKTQNILFSQYDISGDDGRFIVVKVADFGSAQVSA